jgi:hypothetical protein
MKSLNSSDSIGVFHPPELGCVLFLPGLPGGGIKVYDRSPYGNIGTVTGAVWKVTPGGVPCLHFDGLDDVVNCGKGASLNDILQYTYKAWIYATGWGESNLGRVFDKGQVVPLYFANNLGQVWSLRNFTVQYGRWRTPSGSVLLNKWEHLVVIYDCSSPSNDPKIYVNGISQAITEVNTPSGVASSDSASDLRIGNSSDTSATFEGDIALAEVHCRIWSALDVQNSFNREKRIFGVW